MVLLIGAEDSDFCLEKHRSQDTKGAQTTRRLGTRLRKAAVCSRIKHYHITETYFKYRIRRFSLVYLICFFYDKSNGILRVPMQPEPQSNL